MRSTPVQAGSAFFAAGGLALLFSVIAFALGLSTWGMSAGILALGSLAMATCALGG